MNPVVVQLANGNAFFIGMGMTIAMFALCLWAKSRIQNFLLNIGCLFGIGLVIVSATSISIWLYVFWVGVTIWVWSKRKIWQSFKSKVMVAVLYGIFSLIICLIEVPFHFASAIPVSRAQTVYIIGDSISAGIDEKERPWPVVLGNLSGLNVVNLAKAGATVDTAMDQAVRITSTNAVVIVEIGGNDLLGRTDSHTFYAELDKLLSKLKSENRQIVMFELPLLPFWNNFGRDQRQLANKYGAILIPKRYLVSVFAGSGNTIDGLHLSQRGNDELAGTVFGLMKISS
jgi:acyl-CoA thioesterase I